VIVPKGDPRAHPPARRSPFSPFGRRSQPTTKSALPAGFRPILSASGSGCASMGGTCKLASQCTTGRTQSGLCPGAANVKCCLPAAAPTPKPSGGVSPTPAPSSSNCGAYGSLPTTPKTGNNRVSYQTVPIQRGDMVTPSDYGVSDSEADNTMVKSTACVFARMKAAALAAGIDLKIASGFRTIARQNYFWNCYQTKRCNGGNLAARPGTSNHGTGIALDLNTDCGGQTNGQKAPSLCKSSKVYMWLLNNAQKFGFIRAVNKEPWHWELHPGASQPWYASF